jgi:hypothetical protein
VAFAPRLFDNIASPVLTQARIVAQTRYRAAMVLPLLSSTPPEHHAKIDHATQVLLALERQFAQKPALY